MKNFLLKFLTLTFIVCTVLTVASACNKESERPQHIPVASWTKTQTHHYHACKINDCTEQFNYEKHTFDTNKKCIICEYTTTALIGTEISSTFYNIDGTNLFAKVPNNQTSFSFADTIEVANGASYKVYTDIGCKDADCIPSYTVNLSVKDNTYYILVSHEDTAPKVYTVTVRRRPMYEITFDTIGGTTIQSQMVEEDSFAIEPIEQTYRTGYTFIGWNYDFSTPITHPVSISAQWKINQYSLTIVYNNGQSDNILTQDYNSNIESIESPVRDGYVFTGWDKTMPSVMPAENTTVTAKWQAIFTTFDNTITGLTDYGKTLTEIAIPKNIDGFDILHIGAYAFYNNSSLSNIAIPNGVTSIGNYAFYECSSLTSVSITNR